MNQNEHHTFKRVLAVVAHGDDEVIGCGGTLATLSDRGSSVIAVICTGRGLDEETDAAATRLGIESMILPITVDMNLYGYGVARLADTILEHIRRIRPSLIITHSRHDVNQDHRAVHDAVLVAARPPTTDAQLWAFRGEGSDWGCGSFGTFTPTIFFDISNVLYRKTHALSAYESQLKSAPHPRAIDNVRTQARYWGSIAGVSAAEPFELLRAIH